jgi:hypothetical protein
LLRNIAQDLELEYILWKKLYSDQMKADGKEKACSAIERLCNTCTVLVGKPEVRDHLGNLNTDGRIILTCVVRKQVCQRGRITRENNKDKVQHPGDDK